MSYYIELAEERKLDLKGVINRATFLAINHFLENHQESLDNTTPSERTIFIENNKPKIELSNIIEALNYFKS